MSLRRRLAGHVCLAVTFAVLSAVATRVAVAVPEKEIRGAVDVFLEDPDFQREPPYELPNATESADDPIQKTIWHVFEALTALQPVARGLMWVIIATTMGLVGVWLLTEFRGAPRSARRAAAKVLVSEPGTGDTEEPASSPLEEAEALAEQGQYAEASHALLLWTLQELRQLLNTPLAPSLTSREILEHVALPTDARAALSGLVSAVEVSHFGDKPLARVDYEACRADFKRFVDAFRQRAP